MFGRRKPQPVVALPLDIRPGDTVLLQASEALTHPQLARIKRQAREQLLENLVLVFDSSVNVAGVVRAIERAEAGA